MEAQRPPVTFHFETSPHVMIVEANFYTPISAQLLKGALAALDKAGATHEVISVPGALEIAAAISYAMKALDFDPLRRRADGYLALGCVIKGGTHHDEIVAFESARALQDMAMRRSLAIGNGILTCNSIDQAHERADPARLNRGGEAADACLRMIELKHFFHLSPKRRWTAKKT